MPNFSDLKSALTSWAWDESTEYAAVLDTIIALAEDRVFDALPELACYETSATGTLSQNVATFARPSGAVFFRSMEILDGTTWRPVEFRDYKTLRQVWPSSSSAARPRYYGEETSTLLRVAPTPDAAYSYKLIYSQKLTPLSLGNPTNWFTANAYNVLLYAGLVESYLWKDDGENLQKSLGAFGRTVNDLRRRHGLAQRDDFAALTGAFTVDNQGQAPATVAQAPQVTPNG